MSERLLIGLVTAFSWSVPSAVNQHVADLALELRALGHCPVVVTSSDLLGDEERMRALFHRTRGQVGELLHAYRDGAEPDPLLLPLPRSGPLSPADKIPVLPLGPSLPVRLSGSVVNLGLPVDVTSRLERLIVVADFDILHVHEPLAPSLSFTALREARSPVVGTFHLTPAASAAYDIGQAILERFYLRLDARVVTFPGGRDFLEELYPGSYRVVSCGSRLGHNLWEQETLPTQEEADRILAGRGREAFALYVYRGDGRRSFRALLRALASGFPPELETLVVALHRPSVSRWVPRAVPRRLASRVTLMEFDAPSELESLYRSAALVILPYLGGDWLCSTAAEAAVCGCPIVGPDLPPVRDFLGAHNWECLESHATAVGTAVGGENGRGGRSIEGSEAYSWGATFAPSESGSLREAVRLVFSTQAAWSGEREKGYDDAHPRSRWAWAAPHCMGTVAQQLVSLYEDTLKATRGVKGAHGRTPVARHSLHVRTVGEGGALRRARRAFAAAARRDWITADLHIHTEFSKDCTTSVEALIATAREIGIGALAITDHNEIQGAFVAQEIAQGDPFVIIGEEVKTLEGEVIGLFLKELIPGGLSFDETLSLIKEQGGLVYVPHPFDALRTTPSYRTLVDNLHRIDVIEVYNAKVALSAFNLSAERFAAKYNLVAGAGSDAHILQALGTAMLRMPRFHDPESFMEALWEADVIARRKNLLYLQSLKLLQTTLDRILPED
ncbi:MAG: glycosyltransferase [Thermoleophilia bacterium]|nr:glycosyltransferase [Thermoleophilia bacterium]